MTALLFDQNLSRRLVVRLADVFPASEHVRGAGLARSNDLTVWRYALTRQLILVTKDADFGELGALASERPKVIWIRRGNCTVTVIEKLLRENQAAIEQLAASDDDRILTLY